VIRSLGRHRKALKRAPEAHARVPRWLILVTVTVPLSAMLTHIAVMSNVLFGVGPLEKAQGGIALFKWFYILV
jgi:hypothetical protein